MAMAELTGYVTEVPPVRRWLRKHLKRYMIRPIIYKAFSRFLPALTLALLWDRFVNTANLVSPSYAYTILGLIFFALAWISYLRLDGIRLPVAKLLPLGTKKRSFGAFSDIPDYLDQEVVSFDELAEEERDTCSLLANMICGTAFLFWSLM